MAGLDKLQQFAKFNLTFLYFNSYHRMNEDIVGEEVVRLHKEIDLQQEDDIEGTIYDILTQFFCLNISR